MVIDETIDLNGEIEIPRGEVSFNFPNDIQRQTVWLCVQLFSQGGAYVPSE
jgi:hypothetical protein